MLVARSTPQLRVLGASAAACAGAAALGFLAWQHGPWRRKVVRAHLPEKRRQGGAAEKAARLVGAPGPGGFSADEEIQRCARVEEVLTVLQSLGGASLRGHTLGVPCRHRALVELSGMLADYREMLEDGAVFESCGGEGGAQQTSTALQAVIAADSDRHLVFEVGAGQEVPELGVLAGALSDLLESCRCDAAARDGTAADLMEAWLQDRKAAFDTFREHIRQCLKAANPWVMYD